MSKLTSFDETKIWYEYTKQSDLCLVFIHGWANDYTTWEKEIEFFKEKKYSTLTLDLRGHGQSDKPEENEKYSLDCFAKDIKHLVEHEKISNFVLVGHSMGGMVSLVFERLFVKESKGFILCSTAANVVKYHPLKYTTPFIKYVLKFLIEHEHIKKEHFMKLANIDLNKFANSSDYTVFFEGLHNTPMKSVFACFEAMLDYSAEDVLKSIQVPTLIIEGEEDKLLPTVHSVNLFEEIPNAEIDFVPKGRHFVTLEAPELVSNYIFSFLQKHDLK